MLMIVLPSMPIRCAQGGRLALRLSLTTPEGSYPARSTATSHRCNSRSPFFRLPTGWWVCDRGEEPNLILRPFTAPTVKSVVVKRDRRAAFWVQEMTDIGSPGARALHLERLGVWIALPQRRLLTRIHYALRGCPRKQTASASNSGNHLGRPKRISSPCSFAHIGCKP